MIEDKNNSYILLMDQGFFPYGTKSKEFLLKRCLYLCKHLFLHGAEQVIFACNTLSLIALPFVRLFYHNTTGVFQDFLPYLCPDNALIASKRTIELLRYNYPFMLFIDGTKLIYCIERGFDYNSELERVNQQLINKKGIILACTHFLTLPKNSFLVEEIRNKKKLTK